MRRRLRTRRCPRRSWERSARRASPRGAARSPHGHGAHLPVPASRPATAGFTLTELPGAAGGRRGKSGASAGYKQPRPRRCLLGAPTLTAPSSPAVAARTRTDAARPFPRPSPSSSRGGGGARDAGTCRERGLPSPAPPRRPPRPAPPPPRVSPPGQRRAEPRRAALGAHGPRPAGLSRTQRRAGGRRGAAPPMLRSQPPRRRPGPGP